MNKQSKESIQSTLDWGLEKRVRLSCILKNGLTQSEQIKEENAELYHKISFEPHFEFDGWYSGYMFYPDDKPQGLMDFKVDSFVAVHIEEEITNSSKSNN